MNKLVAVTTATSSSGTAVPASIACTADPIVDRAFEQPCGGLLELGEPEVAVDAEASPAA